MSKLTDNINQWMTEVKKDLITNYDKKGFRASGKYEKDLQSVVTETKATLYSAKHSYWMENGRGKNKDQSLEGLRKFAVWAGNSFIKQWLEDKNLKADPIAVAYNIGLKGYSVSKRPNVISSVINEERIKK